MNNYLIWPGAYDFKQELAMLLQYAKEQIELLLYKITEMERNLYS